MMTNRNFNNELDDSQNAPHEKYAYGFDFDVIHPFMLRAFSSWFRSGNCLELGCHEGRFTQKLLSHFTQEQLTCVEAASNAIGVAKNNPSFAGIDFINASFEDAALKKRFDNIVMTHVLEHVDDPVKVLKRVNDEWLSDSGRFFLACPNANAPSRQIAVRMGLISHNAAVTPAEAEHGHHRTYTLDTLERDAVAAGLNVVYRSGIFFKALANFQWDHLLKTDIISPEYLEGCYKIGQLYPDLCSSIFLVCERSK